MTELLVHHMLKKQEPGMSPGSFVRLHKLRRKL